VLCLTNNYGLWIGWLDLLALLLQLLLITVNCNNSHQLLYKTCSFPSWTTSVFLLLLLTWLWFTNRPFFSFRCPLVNTPQLNTQSRLTWTTIVLRINWLTTPVRLNQWTTCPPFITPCEPKIEHYLQQIVYWSVWSVVTEMCLPNRCLAKDYSASTHCHVNMC
jgi:hypothetical protein